MNDEGDTYMEKDDREVLTPERIKKDLESGVKADLFEYGLISAVILVLGGIIVAYWLSNLDGIRPEYKTLFVTPAVLLALGGLATVAALMLRVWNRHRMVVQGQYEVLQDKLVNVIYNENPRGADISHWYFENYGPFKRPGWCKKRAYGTPYVLVIFKDKKETLATLYNLEKYRLAGDETGGGE
jgi:hypothetical protein